MIKHTVGNLIENVRRGHIIHGCNAQGVMGGGFAKFIREAYPEVFTTYREQYEKHGLKVGSVIPVYVERSNTQVVVWNCITQENFGSDGKQYTDYEAVKECVRFVDKHFPVYDVDQKVHFPLIGSVLGGGNWNIIEKIIDDGFVNIQDKTLWTLTQNDYINAKSRG